MKYNGTPDAVAAEGVGFFGLLVKAKAHAFAEES
jgi:hypothetical protein